MVADDLGDDEVQEFLREGRVQFRALGEFPQPGDLACLARGVGGRQLVFGLEDADLLGAFEALGEHVHDRRVDVVDAFAQPGEFGPDGVVDGLGRGGLVGAGESLMICELRRIGEDRRRVFGIRNAVAPAAVDGASLLFAEADGGGADPSGEEPGEVGGVVVADAAGDGGDGEFGGGEEFLGAAEADGEQVVLGAAAGGAADGGAQFGGGHAVAGGVFGDGEGLEGVAGEGGEDGVAVGVGVGAGAAQGDEEFVDGGAGLDFEEGVAGSGGARDAADGVAGGGGVGEGDDGPVGFDVAEFGVGGGGGSCEVDEGLVPAGAGVGAVVVGVPGVSQSRAGAVTVVRRPSAPRCQPLPAETTTATWWSRVRGPTVGRVPCWSPTPRQTRPRRWWTGLGVK